MRLLEAARITQHSRLRSTGCTWNTPANGSLPANTSRSSHDLPCVFPDQRTCLRCSSVRRSLPRLSGRTARDRHRSKRGADRVRANAQPHRGEPKMSTGDLFEPEPSRVTGQPRYMCQGVECVKARPRDGKYCAQCQKIAYYVHFYRTSKGRWPAAAEGALIQRCIDLMQREKI